MSKLSESDEPPAALDDQAAIIADLWRAVTPLSHLDRAMRVANRCLRGVPNVHLRIVSLLTGAAATRVVEAGAGVNVATGRVPVIVAVERGHRLLGALRVTVEPRHRAEERPVNELLETLADAFAVVIEHRAVKVDLAQRRHDLVALRHQMERAAEALATVGAHLAPVAMGLAARLDTTNESSRQSDVSLAHAMAAAQQAHRRATAALYPRSGDRELPSWLRRVAHGFGRANRVDVTVRVLGEPHELAEQVTDVISTLVVEWLLSAAGETRASCMSMLLAYSSRGVSLVIRDDGVGIRRRNLFAGPSNLRSLERLVEDSGGWIRVRDESPRGVTVGLEFGAPWEDDGRA